MKASCAALLGLALLAPAPPDDIDLLVPGRRGPTRLRLQVTVDGRGPTVAWRAFLDKLFDHFDRDGDGFLSRAEVARIFPLPLPAGREALLDFAGADTNKDGKLSRAEFQAAYRAAGFVPVRLVIEPPSRNALRVSEALFRHLGAGPDGTLSKAELAAAPRLLRKLDEDEDEALTVAEVLATAGKETGQAEGGLRAVPVDSRARPAKVLRLALDNEKGRRVELPGAVFAVPDLSAAQEANFAATRRFYLAPFKAALDGKAALTKAELEESAGAEVLVGLFDAADRNGDGKLTLAELTAFLALIESGVRSQVVLTIRERGRNLFDLLDENVDGKLDLRELNRAHQRGPLTRATVPWHFHLDETVRLPESMFGPVALAAPVKRPAAKPERAARGPAWFRAMDRNGDGFVSPGEFLGPPELFRRLDADGDGLISVAEAELAERKK